LPEWRQGSDSLDASAPVGFEPECPAGRKAVVYCCIHPEEMLATSTNVGYARSGRKGRFTVTHGGNRRFHDGSEDRQGPVRAVAGADRTGWRRDLR